MNCNPFTWGHRYLIEYASSMCEILYVFVVEEDKSVFKFKDRFQMVQLGTADIKNVKVIPSGKFIISQRTFEAYSNKAKLQDQVIDASMDVDIFCNNIAPSLGINCRFVGQEPFDNVTRQYNETMKYILPSYGIELYEIPRKEINGQVVSASRVRKAMEKGDFDEVEKIVPVTTADDLKKLQNKGFGEKSGENF